jgi:hypothetical protein
MRIARGLTAACAIVTCAGALAPARAETREFDRPGIAFAPSTLPAGAVAWEQGSPDVERDASNGTTETRYSANTRLRVGVTRCFELQLAVPSYVWVDTEENAGGDRSESGIGDVGIVLKLALPSKLDRFAWAAEATVSFPSGKDAIGNGTEQYSVGATAAWALTERQSATFYANVDVLRGDATWTISPNWSFPLLDAVGGYVEAGYSFGHADGQPDDVVAGGGLTWMVIPVVQLDAYGLAGLTGASTDLQAGCGVSVYFD